jgi:GNAT superfamily N-acetyltransferase
MLVEAVNWSPEWKKQSRRRVLSAPNTARYIGGWPRENDLGVVAEVRRHDASGPTASDTSTSDTSASDTGTPGTTASDTSASDTDITDGERIGAAWLRFFTAADHGYGFVADDVPELTIGVAVRWRGRGVGRALLRAIACQASEAGIKQISLSVERKNFARQLYLSEGYQVVDGSDPQSDTMLTTLAQARRPARPARPDC